MHHHPKVLLIYHEILVRKSLEHSLENEGFTVITVTAGEEAYKKVLSSQPDIIVLDVVMPKIDAYNVLKQIQANEATRKIPVVFVTANNDIEQGIKGLEEGAVDFLTKPLYFREVIARIKIHLRLKEYEDELNRKNKELEEFSGLLLDFNAKLEEMARHDELTQIWNRRAFNEQINQIHNYSLRYARPYSIIIIDLDHFKNYNDVYGHQKGDIVLQMVAKTIEKTSRITDFVARYGGEEIMVLLPETAEADAGKIAERIINAVRELKIKHEDNQNIDIVTVSIGLTTYNPKAPKAEGWEELLKRADEALYNAKKTGRNCVCIK